MMGEGKIRNDVIEAKLASGETGKSEMPLGVNGITQRSESVSRSHDLEAAEALARQTGFMASYSDRIQAIAEDTKETGFLSKKYENPIPKELARIEHDFKELTRQKTGQQFLEELADPKLIGNTSDPHTLIELAIAHSLLMELAEEQRLNSQIKKTELIASIQSKGHELRDQAHWLRNLLKGQAATSQAPKAVVPKPTPVLRSTAAEGIKTPQDSKLLSIDAAFGKVEKQTELIIINEIKEALTSKIGTGFVNNRKEPGGVLNTGGYRNRGLINVDEHQADQIQETIDGNFPSTANNNRLETGESRVRLISNYNELQPYSSEKRPSIKMDPNMEIIELTYRVTSIDRQERSGVQRMFLMVPKQLAEKVFKMIEDKAETDPTIAERILGHALGEDLDINYEGKTAKLNVNKLNAVRN
ncbi:MAG: hypothetical protein NT141_03155 [candidate division WWE3 bacterium]|nr:hypothetical protein [candidate division WWE3 bacterium]